MLEPRSGRSEPNISVQLIERHRLARVTRIAAPLVALAEDFEQQLRRRSIDERHEAEFVDDQKVDTLPVSFCRRNRRLDGP